MTITLYKSQGFSMQPFVLDGDELIVNTSPGACYAVGDIVLYRSPSFMQPVAHRVVGFGDAPTVLMVRADASPTMTETVPSDAIIGSVHFLKRNGSVIRVGGTRTTALVNHSIARYYPAALSAKETIVRILLPAVAHVQRLALYKGLASRFLIPAIRVERQAGTDGARIVATVHGQYAGRVDVECREVHGTRRGLHGTRIGWVSALEVRVRYRGAGIGTRLIDAAEQHAEQIGIRELRLEYEKGNRAAEGLYRACHYQEVAPNLADGSPGIPTFKKILALPGIAWVVLSPLP